MKYSFVKILALMLVVSLLFSCSSPSLDKPIEDNTENDPTVNEQQEKQPEMRQVTLLSSEKQYDELGNLISVNEYEYDAQGRKVKFSETGEGEFDFDYGYVHREEKWQYDEDGKLINHIATKVRKSDLLVVHTKVTDYEYGDNGTLIRETITESSEDSGFVQTIDYTYDDELRVATKTVTENGSVRSTQTFTREEGKVFVLVESNFLSVIEENTYTPNIDKFETHYIVRKNFSGKVLGEQEKTNTYNDNGDIVMAKTRSITPVKDGVKEKIEERSYYYDENGVLESSVLKTISESGESSYTTTYEYDDNGNKIFENGFDRDGSLSYTTAYEYQTITVED